jgi:hypothetical protein
MSYRLITNAKFTVTSAAGAVTERNVEVRLYPAPKRDASGLITVDGVETQYKRTGGKGRGTADNRYAYATVKAQSGFWAITESEAAAMVGGRVALDSIAAEVAPVAAEEAAEPAAAAETPAAEPAAEVIPTKRRGGKKADEKVEPATEPVVEAAAEAKAE